MRPEGEPILEAEGLGKDYLLPNGLFAPPGVLRAVDEVSFSVAPGTTLAVVGESGCGKSTLARLVTMIEPPTTGRLRFRGVDVAGATPAQLKNLRASIQIIFQDPYGSLNPRKRIGEMLEEPLIINTALDAASRAERVALMLERVGLRPEHARRYPHMFSGGQRQRVAIARSLMLRPDMVVADEPVSALDISVRAQILNLLMDLQDETGVAYLFISHDLAVVERIADTVMVMYLGRVVEEGPVGRVLAQPQHPYTQALVAAAPSMDRARQSAAAVTLKGELPSPLQRVVGCALASRCPRATSECRAVRPILRHVNSQRVACHHPDGVDNHEGIVIRG